MADRNSRVRIEAEDTASSVFDAFADNVTRDMRKVDDAGRALDRFGGALDGMIDQMGRAGGATGELGVAVEDNSKAMRGWGNDIGTVVSGLADLVTLGSKAKGPLAIITAILAGAKLGELAANATGLSDLGLGDVPGALKEIVTTPFASDRPTEGQYSFTQADRDRIRGETEINDADRAESRRLAAAEFQRKQDEANERYKQATRGGRGVVGDLQNELRDFGASPAEKAANDLMRRFEADIGKNLPQGEQDAALAGAKELVAQYRASFELREKLNAEAKQEEETNRKNAEHMADMRDEAEQLRRSVQTPSEKLADETRRIGQLEFLGEIDTGTADRALAAARKRFRPPDEERRSRIADDFAAPTLEARFLRGTSGGGGDQLAALKEQTAEARKQTAQLAQQTQRLAAVEGHAKRTVEELGRLVVAD